MNQITELEISEYYSPEVKNIIASLNFELAEVEKNYNKK
jgi:hypothetical protein